MSKSVILLDLPDYQINQEVSIYFPDTMRIKGTTIPIVDSRPVLILNGTLIYLTQEHIKVLAEWEEDRVRKETIEAITKSFEDILSIDDMRKQFGLDEKGE